MISPEGVSVPALLDAAAEQDREAAVFPDGRVSLTELPALAPRMSRPAAQAESA
ncbi:MAG TPA: hypothetical protein VFW50_18235 [Streptosporangiaceae bacterium]|nr:hypothetical protein [Streptosporangiaceae bacterium]